MFYKRRLIIFGALFLFAVAADGLKFLLVGGPNIINWHSFVHPGWVFANLALLSVGIWRQSPLVWKILFWISFPVFLSALINQYLGFSQVLTYNCMLFNLIFVALYFLLGATKDR